MSARAQFRKWRRSKVADIMQFMVFTGALVWLVLRGADAMNYNWQWHRVPQYLYTIEDGEIIWGPLIDGLMVTLECVQYLQTSHEMNRSTSQLIRSYAKSWVSTYLPRWTNSVKRRSIG